MALRPSQRVARAVRAFVANEEVIHQDSTRTYHLYEEIDGEEVLVDSFEIEESIVGWLISILNNMIADK